MSFVVDSKGGCFLCLRECGTGSSRGGGGGGGASSPSAILSLKLLTRVLGLDIRAVLKTSIDPIYLSQSVRNGEIGVRACGDCSEITGAFSELVAQLERVRLKVAASVARIEGVMLGSERDSQLVREYKRRVVSSSASPQDLIVSDMCEKLRKEMVLQCSKYSRGTFPRVELRRLEGSSTTAGGDDPHPFAVHQSQSPPHGWRSSSGLIKTASANAKNEKVPPLMKTTGVVVVDPVAADSSSSSLTNNEGGGVQCSICSKVISPRNTRAHKCHQSNKSGADSAIKCDLCPMTFLVRSQLTEHQCWSHRSAFFASHKDPRLNTDQFEQAVRDLFADIIPNRTKSEIFQNRGYYKCGLCAELRYPNKSRIVSHYLKVHMDRMVARLEEIQRGRIRVTMISAPAGEFPPHLPRRDDKTGGGGASKGGASGIKCDHCPMTFRINSHHMEHQYSAHRSSCFASVKDPRLNSDQFEQMVADLLAEFIPKFSKSNDKSQIRGAYKCAYCPAVRYTNKSKIVSHYFRVHMEAMVARLKTSQAERVDTSIISGAKKRQLSSIIPVAEENEKEEGMDVDVEEAEGGTFLDDINAVLGI